MSYQKIGFLMSSPGGNPTGIGDYVRALDAAGVPAVVMCNNGDVGIGDALALIDGGSTVPHVMSYRIVPGDPKTGTEYDVPNYGIDPWQAAKNYRDLLMPRMNSNIAKHRDKVWVQLGNEVDHELSEWLAEWGYHSAQLWNSDGYKVCLFNFSSGEPEPTDWRGPQMSAFLQYAGANSHMVSIGLHEYSYTTEGAGIKDGFPYKVGRFQDLIAACKERTSPCPPILITEWGWTYTNIPAFLQAMGDIAAIADVYAQYDEVLGAGMWYLGSGFSKIANKVNQLIDPVTEFSVRYEPPEPPEPPVEPPEPPENRTFERWAWDVGEDEQLMSFNPEAGLQRAIFEDGFVPPMNETWREFPGDGKMYALQSGEHLGTGEKRMYTTPVPEDGRWQEPTWFHEPTEETDPLAGFKIGAPFARPFRLTSAFDEARNYEGNHEGADYDIFTQETDSHEPVLCGVAGVVVAPSPLLAGYGQHVVVETEHRGITVRVWYCHLDRLYVTIGDYVDNGQPLGELGRSGTQPMAEHVHINLQVPGHGLDGYVVPDVVDPHPYVDPEPQPGIQLDLAEYFRSMIVPQHWRGEFYASDLIILKNNWGAGDERVQLQGLDEVWHVVKNSQWERRRIGERYIDLNLDTSPGSDKFYSVEGNSLPRVMGVGEVFTRDEHVRWFHKKPGCPEIPEDETWWTTSMKLAAHYNYYQPKANENQPPGVQFSDVIEFHWIVGGAVVEKRFYARHLGLIEWRNNSGFRSYAVELIPIGSQGDNKREELPCQM